MVHHYTPKPTELVSGSYSEAEDMITEIQKQPALPEELRTIACDRCRQRKSFCSKTMPRCHRCREKNVNCVYKLAKKVTVTEDFIRDLQNKVRLLEVKSKTYERSLGLATQSAASRPLEYREGYQQPDNEEIEATSLLLGRLNVNITGSAYQGAAAADHLLSSLGQFVGIGPGDGITDPNTSSMTRTFYNADLLPSRRLMGTGYIDLPPIEVARDNFKTQYSYIGTIFSFCSPLEFEELLGRGYSQQSQPHMMELGSGLAFSKLLVLLAFGQLYSINKWVGQNGPPGFDFFTAAVQYLPDIHENGSVLFVETLALIGYFMQNLNRRDAALLYVGLASRMAISLGLHEEALNLHLNEATKERRRRVWWSVYSLDCILSAKSGTPLYIASDDVGVNLPSTLLDETQYCPAVVLRHYTMLSRILSDISRKIYGKARKPGVKLVVADVHEIMQQLDQWYKQLPRQLRFCASENISRESISTMLHYYMCLSMTARPLFFHVVQSRLRVDTSRPERTSNRERKEQDWKSGLGETTVSVIEMCIDAATKTVEMMSAAARVNLVATYGYMDSEHAFAAAIVLVMVCVAFPTSKNSIYDMNKALELLKFMADRGNLHLADRLRLLERLRVIATAGYDKKDVTRNTTEQVDLIDIYPADAQSLNTPGESSANAGLSSPWSVSGSSTLHPESDISTTEPDSGTRSGGCYSSGSNPQSWSISSPYIPLSDLALGNVLDATAPSSWNQLGDHMDAGLWEDSFANSDLSMDMDTDLTILTQNMEGVER